MNSKVECDNELFEMNNFNVTVCNDEEVQAFQVKIKGKVQYRNIIAIP